MIGHFVQSFTLLKKTFNSELFVQLNKARHYWLDIIVKKTGCVRAKLGLTGQLGRRHPGNYFKL